MPKTQTHKAKNLYQSYIIIYPGLYKVKTIIKVWCRFFTLSTPSEATRPEYRPQFSFYRLKFMFVKVTQISLNRPELLYLYRG